LGINCDKKNKKRIRAEKNPQPIFQRRIITKNKKESRRARKKSTHAIF
jgi:hypothetical protein